MERPWLKSYPENIDHDISTGDYHCLADVFQEAFKKYNNKPCVTNMGRTLTYGEVDRYSDYFASYLINTCKLQKGDRIAIQLPNVLQYYVILIGAIKAGIIVVNTNPLYTDREMEHQFRDAGVKMVVILENFAHLLEKIISHTDIQHVVITSVGDMLPFPKNKMVNFAVKHVKKMVPSYKLPLATSFKVALEKGKKGSFDVVRSGLEELAFLQYTGGTTGVAKGAMLTNKNIISNMVQVTEWLQNTLNTDKEVILTPLPLYHIFSLTVNCLTFMSLGGHSVLVTNPRDLPDLIKIMKQYKPTCMTGVNTLFNALLNSPKFDRDATAHLKASVAGATALQRSVADQWKERTGTVVIEGYGLTEASPLVSVNPLDGTDEDGSIGLPAPSTYVKLIKDDGTDAVLGETGELCVKGPQVMKGYWQKPDETAKTFNGEWLLTGDIAVMTEKGFFKIVDRKKDMILVSGFNVYPNEVEDVIASHPAVMEVAAIGVPNDRSGETVKIFVVKKSEVTKEDLIEFSRKKLTGYKVPKHVEFREDLPKTAVGKILRKDLRNEELAKLEA